MPLNRGKFQVTAESPPYDHKVKRAGYWAKGQCGCGCGRPFVLPCGLCRQCADRNKANKKRWKIKQLAKKLNLTTP
jgi:hypothetical protein